VLLSFGLLWTLAVGPLFNALRFADRLMAGLEAEAVLRRIDAEQFPVAAERRERLRRHAEQVRAESEVVTASSGWFSRRLLDGMRTQLLRMLEDASQRENLSAAESVDRALAHFDETEEVHRAAAREYLTVAGLIVFWPLLWVVWAVLWRGGVSLRLAGIVVVRGDGRRASRLRCGWRVLLIWLPVVLLLSASAALDLWRFTRAPDSSWPAWLAWLSWWLAAALPPLYLWLAQRWPERGPLDHLAGTYLVPR
jgi:hypothetical protein